MKILERLEQAYNTNIGKIGNKKWMFNIKSDGLLHLLGNIFSKNKINKSDSKNFIYEKFHWKPVYPKTGTIK